MEVIEEMMNCDMEKIKVMFVNVKMVCKEIMKLSECLWVVSKIKSVIKKRIE
jgi:hypothetical protein